MRTKTAAVAAFLLILTTACQDASGPCDRPYACEVTGVDLFIQQLEIIATSRDPVTGLGIVDPNPLTIEFAVINRGDSVSAPATLVLRYLALQYFRAEDDSLPIPALRPGENYQQRVSMDTWESLGIPRDIPANWGPPQGSEDTAHVTAHLLADDADNSNNQRESPRVHVRIPLVRIAFQVTDTILRVNSPFTLRVEVTNVARHGHLNASAIGFVAWIPFEIPGGPSGFGTHDIATLPAGSIYERALTLTIPPNAVFQHAATRYQLVAKLTQQDTRDSTLIRAYGYVYHDGPVITIQPDYSFCQPATLRADAWVSAPAVCRHPTPFYLFRLNAQTDRLYAIDQLEHPGAAVYTADGMHLGTVNPGQWIQFSAEGTYYIADFLGRRFDVPPTSSMLLREEPL